MFLHILTVLKGLKYLIRTCGLTFKGTCSYDYRRSFETFEGLSQVPGFPV